MQPPARQPRRLAAAAIFAGSGLLLLSLLVGDASAEPVSGGAHPAAEAPAPQPQKRPTPQKRVKRVLPQRDMGGY